MRKTIQLLFAIPWLIFGVHNTSLSSELVNTNSESKSFQPFDCKKLKTEYKEFAVKRMQKIYFDLPKLAKYILLNSNISGVHDTKKNTFLDKNYFSFRESKKKKLKDYGRNINLISII